MKDKTTVRKNSAIDYLGYALYAFGGLGIEILLMMAETNIYGHAYDAWSAMDPHYLCGIYGSFHGTHHLYNYCHRLHESHPA